jgi:hypothetical protein
VSESQNTLKGKAVPGRRHVRGYRWQKPSLKVAANHPARRSGKASKTGKAYRLSSKFGNVEGLPGVISEAQRSSSIPNDARRSGRLNFPNGRLGLYERDRNCRVCHFNASDVLWIKLDISITIAEITIRRASFGFLARLHDFRQDA